MSDPRTYQAVMLSSTFLDLEEHRREAIAAIDALGFRHIAMEDSGAADADVIDTSLKMVRDSAAYALVIGHRYGKPPVCARRNPEKLSLTELEFREAMRLRRPMLLFLMGEKHPVTRADIESDPDLRDKLEAFRMLARRMREDSEVERVFEVFESQARFAKQFSLALAKLAPKLGRAGGTTDNAAAEERVLPRPPALAALPAYLGSHNFVGRREQLAVLDDWCDEADPNPVLLFEAIGGSGKSFLTWKWLRERAPKVRRDWAGYFWYSFYEKGAVMTDFCRHALAYMTEQPVKSFHKRSTPVLADQLIAELDRRPWLLVLDGLERVLVTYHRPDAAQMRDEEADLGIDQIQDRKRDPCAAVRPDDDDLLRRLTGVSRSKVLISSRLTPQAFINNANNTRPGLRRSMLPGLLADDAEKMMHACGVRGDSRALQTYLKANCDCHPLVMGALAGLINEYPHDRGSFDAWVSDPAHGGALNLADLDLVQRRNHILNAAIDALAPESLQLLQTLALLQSGADYQMLEAFNPYLPAPPAEVTQPLDPSNRRYWDDLGEDYKKSLKEEYDQECQRYEEYLTALADWKASPELKQAPVRLKETVRDLEKRGLLQYDHADKRYDLHPVVRGVAAGRLGREATEALGQKVVDHFSSRPHDPWESAETLEALTPGMEVVRVYGRMQAYEQAFNAYSDISGALIFTLGSRIEALTLLKQFFPKGFASDEIVPLGDHNRALLFNEAAITLPNSEWRTAVSLLEKCAQIRMQQSNNLALATTLRNIGNTIEPANGPVARAMQAFAAQICELSDDSEGKFGGALDQHWLAVVDNRWDEADAIWSEMEAMGWDWGRATYRPGDAHIVRAWGLFFRGSLTDALLSEFEEIATKGRNRTIQIQLVALRGDWHLRRGEPALARDALEVAVRMGREIGEPQPGAEALLALARLRCGEDIDARNIAERLSGKDQGAFSIAMLWRELGEREKAIEKALIAHKKSVGDGEPYIWRHSLKEVREFLTELGAPLPEVPKYDPASYQPFSWEPELRAYIDKLKAEKAEKERVAAERAALEPKPDTPLH